MNYIKGLSTSSSSPNEGDRISEQFRVLEGEIVALLSFQTGDELRNSVREIIKNSILGSDTDNVVRLIESGMNARLENVKLRERIIDVISRLVSAEREFEIFNEYECSLEIAPNGVILNANDVMIKLSGYSREELVGRNARIMNSGVHSKKFWEDFWNTILSGRVWAGDICNKKKDGSRFWLWTLVIPKMDIDGSILSFKVIRQDISESYILKQRLADTLSQKNDPITGLPSHIKCLEDYSEKKNRSLALFHINDMADINNVYGRGMGNLLIRRVSELLKAFCHQHPALDIHLYKFEGTDFALIFQNGIDENIIKPLYKKLNKSIFSRGGIDIHLSISAGVAMNELNIESLIQKGKVALSQSKHSRALTVSNENDEVDRESQDFFIMQDMIREAWKENLFTIYLQEIVPLKQSANSGQDEKKFECLIRMQNPRDKSKLIGPGAFLPIIKKNGENRKLTSFVLNRVCEEMSKNNHTFSVNLTANDLSTIEDIQRLHNITTKYGIDPKRITFEILEDIDLLENPIILENTKKLKLLGFKIAIDDFGTDHANFSSILYIEPDTIKIDMKYTRDIHKNEKNTSLVRAIVMFAHENKIEIIAEGVQTESEATALRMLCVDYAQGWLYCQPKPIRFVMNKISNS